MIDLQRPEPVFPDLLEPATGSEPQEHGEQAKEPLTFSSSRLPLGSVGALDIDNEDLLTDDNCRLYALDLKETENW